MYRVLIAEPYRGKELIQMLDWDGLGFESVVLAESFREALDQATILRPHVALIGATLEDRMGYELSDRLREMGLNTICCLLTNHFDIHDARRVMRSGCQDVLPRPPEPHVLREFLEWAIGRLHGFSPEVQEEKNGIDPVLGIDCADLNRITNKILEEVHRNYRQSLSLTGMARSMGMSNKYIGRVFLRDTGLRFTEYLMAFRMLEAKRLILDTGEKISVIAGMVGYSQQNNFYTHFHQYFGTSPSSLRNVQASEEAII